MLATRHAILADAALIAAHRRAMFAAMGAAAQDVLDEMTRNFHPWLLPRLVDGRYMGWITEDGGHAIASAGLLLLDWPPHPLHPAGSLRGYILNVFVDPGYRRRGLARALVECCLAEARDRNLQVVTLHASDEGRPLYEGMGFRSSGEMQLVL
ncbi:MAG TPA: GNAT family N-acetyltransferase [Terracidiphilus sp.]|jgi:GNAT superfamily N-acetyltransferase|nr:GNAT family N-acetyltransferase [Terracidiphilus sp.]